MAPAAAFRSEPPGAGIGRRSWLATAGGALAALGAVLVIVACALPYVHYKNSGDSLVPSPSVFNTGFTPSNWFALEPVGVAVIALAAGVVLIVWMARIPRALAAGVLVGLGTQTVLLFLGYVLFAVRSPDTQLEAGGIVGVLAGLLLLAGGVGAAASLLGKAPGHRDSE